MRRTLFESLVRPPLTEPPPVTTPPSVGPFSLVLNNVDGAIVALYLVGMLVVGVVVARRIHGFRDFFEMKQFAATIEFEQAVRFRFGIHFSGCPWASFRPVSSAQPIPNWRSAAKSTSRCRSSGS